MLNGHQLYDVTLYLVSELSSIFINKVTAVGMLSFSFF